MAHTQDDSAVPVAFWLVPAEPDFSRLQSLIDRLADRHRSFTFMPHVSLHVGRCRRKARIDEALHDCAARFGPLSLTAGELEHSDAYYQTLILRVARTQQQTQALAWMQQTLVSSLARLDPEHGGDQAAALRGFVQKPHLSLMYARIGAAKRSLLAAELMESGPDASWMRELRFDRLAAVVPGLGHEDLDEVDRWSLLPLVSLGTGPAV